MLVRGHTVIPKKLPNFSPPLTLHVFKTLPKEIRQRTRLAGTGS